MKMSEEMAVRLHRMMWGDMQKELGDNPYLEERQEYKKRWITKHFPGSMVQSYCFLCEFTHTPHSGAQLCKNCPIEWPDNTCTRGPVNYQASPISDILALPVRNKKLTGLETGYIANDMETATKWYYQYRENLLSKNSGIPATSAIENHVKAIQEKAVEEYFKKTPGAKLATMDVDQAFKQYADEQKVPIFRALAEESGLDPTATVKAHINAIYSKGFDDGKDEEFERIMDKIQEILKK